MYEAVKAACTFGDATLQSIQLDPDGSGQHKFDLNGSSLVADTTGRTAVVTLSDVVRGSAPLTIDVQSTGGITVHGRVTIQPGSQQGSFTFDLDASDGDRGITTLIDADQTLWVSFSASPVTIQSPGQLMPGNGAPVSVSLPTGTTDPSVVVSFGGDSNLAFEPPSQDIGANATQQSVVAQATLQDATSSQVNLDVSVTVGNADAKTYHYSIGATGFQLLAGGSWPPGQAQTPLTDNAVIHAPGNELGQPEIDFTIVLSQPVSSDTTIDVSISGVPESTTVTIAAGGSTGTGSLLLNRRRQRHHPVDRRHRDRLGVVHAPG